MELLDALEISRLPPISGVQGALAGRTFCYRAPAHQVSALRRARMMRKDVFCGQIQSMSLQNEIIFRSLNWVARKEGQP